MREQLGFSQTLTAKHIAAQIVGRDPNNLYSALVIGKGTIAGVRKDMPVIAFQGGTQGLVGKVIYVGAFDALVMPVYDSRSFISARLAETRNEGIVEGQGNPDSPLLMRFIQKWARDEISVGDLAVTSGMGGIYPPGIAIGRISRLIYRESEISMELEMKGVIDFSRLEYLFVIDNQSGQNNQRDSGAGGSAQ